MRLVARIGHTELLFERGEINYVLSKMRQGTD